MLKETPFIWMDGKMVPWKEANVHVLTHTLHYGLGVFEGIRCYKGKSGTAIFRLSDHVERLLGSAHIVKMKIPYSAQEIEQAIIETVRINKLEEGYIRPIAFLGYGEMGLYVNENPVQLVIAAWPWGTYLGADGVKNGIRTCISSLTRHPVNVSMARAKVTGHYVNSQFAKREAKEAGFDEAILLDADGFVAEGPGENIFIVKRGGLKTTPLTSVLEGITRDTIMEIAKKNGIPVSEERFTRDDLYLAQEAFFTGTAAEVTPIREVDGRTIGSGKPGPITKLLQENFFKIVHNEQTMNANWLSFV
ncbi:MAG: branched-chain amino acid transaminase [Nitrospirota bacterium]